MMRLILIIALNMTLWIPSSLADDTMTAADNMAVAKEAWTLRGDGFKDGVVDTTQLERCIKALETEVSEHSDNLEACAMLMNALYFKGDLVAKDKESKKKIYDRGLEISALAFKTLLPGKDPTDLKPEKLAKQIKANEQAVPVCFWTSVMWGLWGDNYGSFQAARKGVAGKIRHYADTVILLDSKAFDGGGYRMLGRLHTLAPKVPFFTGWIDRDKAVSYLEQAVASSDNEPLNQLYLAEALIKFEDNRKDEGISMLEALKDWKVDPSKLVEQSTAMKRAEALLAESK